MYVSFIIRLNSVLILLYSFYIQEVPFYIFYKYLDKYLEIFDFLNGF